MSNRATQQCNMSPYCHAMPHAWGHNFKCLDSSDLSVYFLVCDTAEHSNG